MTLWVEKRMFHSLISAHIFGSKALNLTPDVICVFQFSDCLGSAVAMLYVTHPAQPHICVNCPCPLLSPVLRRRSS